MHTPRHRVFLIHIAISTTLMLILLSVMALWWYPNGLFGIAGGWAGLKILLPIDMVLGPALTFLFYKPGKKSAVFDLSAIACVQLVALGYGVFAVYSQHPQALVLAEGKLQTLTHRDYKEAVSQLESDKQQSFDLYDIDKNLPPVVVAKPFPKEAYGDYLASVLNGKLELIQRAERYQDLKTGGETFQAAQMDHQALVDALGQDYNKELNYLRLNSMHGTGVAAFSKEDGHFIRAYPRKKQPIAAALSEKD